MRALSRTTAARTARPVLFRFPAVLVLVGFLAVVTALTVWRDGPLFVVVPFAVLTVGIAGLVAARRALRRASDRIDAILSEELEPRADGGSRRDADE